MSLNHLKCVDVDFVNNAASYNGVGHGQLMVITITEIKVPQQFTPVIFPSSRGEMND